jgi:predicted metal-dependent enzyme (double-stranded beta helix superfamily)
VSAILDAMFDVDELLGDLERVRLESEPRRAAREVMARAVSRSDEIADALTPTMGGLNLLYHAPDLTVLNIVWAPGMRLMPHDHRMWAVIGIYTGAEDNEFFRRDPQHSLVTSNGRRLEVGDVAALGTETIHAVTNPLDKLTAAIHVYGGDFVNEPRSQWGPGDLVERPFDMNDVTRQFAEANDAAVAAGLLAAQ